MNLATRPPDDNASLWAEAARLEAAGEPATLCTVVGASGSVPRGLGARMIVYPDGRTFGTIGGGALEERLVAHCRSQPVEVPTLVHIDLARDAAMACGGQVSLLLEPLGQTAWLVIFGAGHIAAELAPMAVRCGFRVAVADSDATYCRADRFPDASLHVPSLEPPEWKRLPLGERAYCVIMTRAHSLDLEVLARLLDYRLAYLGMIGSRRKVEEIFDALRARGVTDADLSRVRAPVGLDIGAETPAEIAVSILAEIIAVRRRSRVDRLGEPLSSCRQA